MLSLFPDESDEQFWHEHAYVRLRPNTRIETEPREIILDNRIWFGSVASQDDIFEGSPPFSANPHSLNYESILELARRNMHGAPAGEIELEAMRIFEELSDPNIFNERTRRIIERYLRLFRSSSILSFFREADVQRNWSEYANRGRGFGVVFDFREPWTYEGAPEMNGSWVPFDVRYVPADHPPAIIINAAPVNREDGFKDIETALLTKSDEWSNQNEARLLRIGIGEGHVTFPPCSLRAVILGHDAREELENHIIELNAARPNPIQILKSQPNPPSRRLAIRRIR